MVGALTVCALACDRTARSSSPIDAGIRVQLKKSYRWLYRWFLPLLRMDTVPNFVQLIKTCAG
jgi:hypothetical protein